MKQRRSKAIDMRFYWIRDRVRQGKFIIYWRHRALNKADYFTKHHPVSHHQQIRSSYLHMLLPTLHATTSNVSRMNLVLPCPTRLPVRVC
jgi:predicted transposase YdaD